MEWNRDLRMSITDIRTHEEGMIDKPDRGEATVCFEEMVRGNVKICFATLIARYAKPDHALGGWRSPEQAWAQTSAQLSWYREMERQGYLYHIKDLDGLNQHLSTTEQGEDHTLPQIGYLLTLEGADSIVTFDHLYERHAQGLRAIGPAHYGPGTYAYGTDSEGGIGEKGRELLQKMDELNIVLDATHLCDISFWEAMEVFKGPVWASHSNCRSLVDHNRQFSDDQIRVLVNRGAIIGMPLDAWMMVPDWQRGVSHPSNTAVKLTDMLDHLDHICGLVGSADHVAIGTDLDGGFGREQCPSDISSIADLQKIPNMLNQRGYTDKDVTKIMSGNWLGKLHEVLK